uniref:Uncharacterized protein n=1 Tax=Triticum urartu TaxID=4572 RepID=A0A8R7QBU6_TRIUA
MTTSTEDTMEGMVVETSTGLVSTGEIVGLCSLTSEVTSS